MRIIVYGLGAIGGVVAAALANAGREVVGIARGGMLAAVSADGLKMTSIRGETQVRFDCVGHPSDIAFLDDDVILMCMKGQDTPPALEALRAAGVRAQPIFCCQNGVANERRALRIFPNVHGVTVMMPATYVAPGHVAIFVEPAFGMFDIGRFPGGVDADDTALAEALNAANIAAFTMPDVMASKYGKLLMNLTNIVEAALGPGNRPIELGERLRAEGRAVLEAAGIDWRAVGGTDPRRDQFIRGAKLNSVASAGSSTTQSLLRGTGSIETDLLNGEISMLGRLHGVPTPRNDRLTLLSAELVGSGAAPGSMTLAQLEALLPG